MPDPVNAIRRAAQTLGFDACGVARVESLENTADGAYFREWIASGAHGDMDYLARGAPARLHPHRVLPGARAVVCVALNYGHPEPPVKPGLRGVVARYALGRDYHKVFTRKLKDLERAMAEVLPGCATRRYADTGPVLEKLWAQRAGVGWRGKHTNVVSRKLGSWLFLGEILVDRELTPSAAEDDHCGTCTRCIEACPTGAITAPYRLDARLCISYLTIEHRGPIPVELRSQVGMRIFGCDDCLEVCPWNRFAQEAAEPDFEPRPGLLAPLLLELVNMSEEVFYARFAGTPVVRAKREGMVRNVCVALGNCAGELTDPEEQARVRAALEEAKRGETEMVAEHAGWALEQISRRSP